jgi:hypothetical protein
MSLIDRLKPTPVKLGAAFLLLFLLIPAVQLTQSGCQDYARLPYGDGAQPPKCLDGARTMFSYVLLKGHITKELESYGGWGWKLYEQPLYPNLIGGVLLSYLASALAVSYVRPRRLEVKTKD